MKSLGLIALLTACAFEHGVPAGNGPRDGGPDTPGVSDPDAMPDAPNANCFGAPPFGVCPTTQPTQALDINSNIDTDGTAPSCDNGRGVVMTVGGTESCVLAGTDITFSGNSTTGSGGARPLVLIATGTITVASGQTLDARSAANGSVIGDGPGANPADCGLPATATSTGGNGGGGAGGSFGTKGANGASGGNGATGATAKMAATAPVAKLRGGCQGGNGADGATANSGGAGGAGGGAVLLIAKTKIQIDGTITVSGAGGSGGTAQKGGGGGGGSGGMIALHAPTITVGASGQLMANGGGGGGGAGMGTSGEDGLDATAINAAAGGAPTNGGGTTAGGAGAFKTTAATTPPAGGGGSGGGGGGGGVGVIRVLSGQTISGNNTSPAATN